MRALVPSEASTTRESTPVSRQRLQSSINWQKEAVFHLDGTPALLSESESEDDFGDDVVASIKADNKLKAEFKANGNKKPRERKENVSQAERQTQKTRKMVLKGECAQRSKQEALLKWFLFVDQARIAK